MDKLLTFFTGYLKSEFVRHAIWSTKSKWSGYSAGRNFCPASLYANARAEWMKPRVPSTSGEEHRCKRSQGDLAHLQEHQAGEEDGPRQSQEAPEEIPPSHSPVRTAPVPVFPVSVCSRVLLCDGTTFWARNCLTPVAQGNGDGAARERTVSFQYCSCRLLFCCFWLQGVRFIAFSLLWHTRQVFPKGFMS